MQINRNLLSEAASKAVGEALRGGAWEVWPGYELAGPLDDLSAPKYVRARPVSVEAVEVERYAPLITYPDLFLKFAHLADGGGLDEELDTDKNARVALEWTHGFGALGLTHHAEDAHRVKADTRGGTEDTVTKFADEAWVAHEALRLYEAATDPKGPDMEAIAPYVLPHDLELYTETPAKAREWAMSIVGGIVQEKVAWNVFPALYPKSPRGVDYELGWDFTSLLGAMWLQMLWLLSTDEDQQRRCKWCNGVIAFRQPEQPQNGLKRNDRSGGYRTRKDKKYCSDRCRNKHFYAQRARH